MIARKVIRDALFAGLAIANLLLGAEIDGTVVITHRLTRPRVTAEVPLYQRGAAVSLGAAREEDPLALDRSRVVVYIEGSGPATPARAKLEQINREFSPELVVIPAGSQVVFPNLDSIFHNVFSLSKAKSFDLGNYPRGESRSVTFRNPGIVYVNCHLHPNMTAAIVITPNDWSARVDRSGHFVIRDVPPGRYTVVAWHQASGFFRQTIELKDGRNGSVEFLMPLNASGAPLEARK